MKTLLEQNNFWRPPKVGEVIKGKVFQKRKSALFLDLGNFKVGIIYGKEFQEAKDFLKNLKIGDEIFAKIIELENEDGYVELSIQEANVELAWEGLREKKEKGESVVIKVKGANKGGLLTEVSSLPAFLPLSQLSPEHYPNLEEGDRSKIVRELQKFIGKELKVKIFNMDARNKNIIISERLGEIKKVKNILKNYNVGDVVEGEITGITDFGAFIKFSQENLDGLIPTSELNPSGVFKIGQKVKAKIIDISNNRVYLSLKNLE